jgi:hypothetical protein
VIAPGAPGLIKSLQTAAKLLKLNQVCARSGSASRGALGRPGRRVAPRPPMADSTLERDTP